MLRPRPRADLQLLVNAFAPSPPLKVLELGCGTGVNAELFHARGDRYTGLDRPPLRVRPYFQGYGTFLEGDFCQAIPSGFDLIVDRGGFVCNGDEALGRAVKLIHEALTPGGMVICADLFAEGNAALQDPIYRSFTLEGLQALFAPFETIHLADTKALGRFDFVGRKPL